MKTIFIVDGNAASRLAVKKILDAAGCYRAFALPSAAAMFKLARGIKPDLILLEADMPEMDGFEAMGLLKTDKKLSAVPVILLTAKNDRNFTARNVKMGAQEYIVKPFNTQDLLMRVDKHTDAGWVDMEVDKIVRAERIKQGTAGQ